jgi:hypothetical protein
MLGHLVRQFTGELRSLPLGNGSDRRLELVLCAPWGTWGKAEMLKAEVMKSQGELQLYLGSTDSLKQSLQRGRLTRGPVRGC